MKTLSFDIQIFMHCGNLKSKDILVLKIFFILVFNNVEGYIEEIDEIEYFSL